MSKPSTSAEELDRLFDEGSVEIDQYFDYDNPLSIDELRPPVIVQLSQPVAIRLDAEAEKLGTTRRELVERWLTDRLDRAA